jgi:polar amino acid transport system substrate-binding protein
MEENVKKSFSYLLMLPACVMIIICMTTGIAGAAERAFTISTSYKSLLSNPDQTGMLDRILKEAFHRLGYNAEIVFSPTEKSLPNVNAGLLDGEINRIEGMERTYPNLVRVPESNMTMNFVAFSKRPHVIDGWESIRHLRIGIVKGWKILEENTHGFPGITFVPTETELFNMLDKDRIDVALYAKLTGYEQIMLRGFTDIHHLEPPLASRDMFLYLHKKHGSLVGELADVLKEMKQDGTYDRIVSEATSHLTMSPQE